MSHSVQGWATHCAQIDECEHEEVFQGDRNSAVPHAHTCDQTRAQVNTHSMNSSLQTKEGGESNCRRSVASVDGASSHGLSFARSSIQ
jgi:hypothetical protein